MIYTSDFETTTDVNDCRVWAWGTCTIDDKYDFEFGNDIKSFIIWCKQHPNSTLYFHNLKFDGQFIIDWLLKNGFSYDEDNNDNTFNCLISKMGQFYSIKICFWNKNKKNKNIITIYDSLKKLPFSVDSIAKAFKLPINKLSIDYNKKRKIGHILSTEEIAYLKHDVLIMAMALKIQFEQGLNKMTIGSDALSSYKVGLNTDFENYFPILNVEIDDFIRKSYRGGSTQCNKKYQGMDIDRGIVFDVNSLYPSQMYYKNMPYGTPIYYYGKYIRNETYNVYIQHITVEFKLKKDHIPSIQVKGTHWYTNTEYIEETVIPTELWLTNVDIELMFEQYNIISIIYHDGYMFKSSNMMFRKYIDYWMEIKANNTGALRTLAKLMLNNLYGKFATNPDVTKKIPYLENGIVKYKLDKKEEKDPVYTAVGSFTTSYGRATTIRSAQQVFDRYLYMDTDSIHLIGTKIPTNIEVHESDLGKWKHESTFTRARFLRPKTYIEEIDGELNVKCAGMTPNIKKDIEYWNFQFGFISWKKIRPKKVVGGIVLEESPFKIKGVDNMEKIIIYTDDIKVQLLVSEWLKKRDIEHKVEKPCKVICEDKQEIMLPIINYITSECDIDSMAKVSYKTIKFIMKETLIKGDK